MYFKVYSSKIRYVSAQYKFLFHFFLRLNKRLNELTVNLLCNAQYKFLFYFLFILIWQYISNKWKENTLDSHKLSMFNIFKINSGMLY